MTTQGGRSAAQKTACVLAALCIAATLISGVFSRPLPNGRERARRARNFFEGIEIPEDVPESGFNPNGISNTPQEDSNTSRKNSSEQQRECYGEHVLQNYTQTVTEWRNDTLVTYEVEFSRWERPCCKDWKGDNCDVPPPPENTTTATEEPTTEPPSDADPCVGLKCDGNPEAVCATVTKCGRTYPVFINPDDRNPARCANGQPVNIDELTCTPLCPTGANNPCRGLTCRSHPEAVCFTTPCDCKPMWLTEYGVEVDCDSGEDLPPMTERNRRDADGNISDDCADGESTR